MSTYSLRYAVAVASFVAAGIAAPLAPALAAAPNMATGVDAGGRVAPMTGVYDGNDQYRDSKGFPLPGWDIIFFPPS